MKSTSPEVLVASLVKVRSEIEQLQATEADIEKSLIALGAGDYEGPEGHVAKVIVPSAPEPKFKLDAKDEDRAREIAGEQFGDLFVRKISFDPCKAFAEVCSKLLTPARFKKLAALCQRPAKPQAAYVRLA